MANLDFGRILGALGQGLIGAGQQGWGAFGPGLMQGAAFYDQGIDRRRQRELDDLTAELRRQQLEDARTAHTDAAEAKRRQQEWLNSIGAGPLAANNGRPGGMAPQGGPMSGDWTPDQIAFLRANPDAAEQVIGAKLFPSPQKEDWKIETIREGSQDVTYRINPATGEREKLGAGSAFAPQQPQQPYSTNLITLVGPDGKSTRSVDSRDAQTLSSLIGQGWVERQTSMFPAAPSGYTYTPSGLAAIPGGPADPSNPNNITADQRKTGSFAKRLESANAIIDANEEAATSYFQSGLSMTPLIGNSLISSERQQIEQAQRDFVNAQLRRESGATIQDTEFENAKKQYFPQPGEGQDVIEQKRKARQLAIENMKREAGAAFQTTPIEDRTDRARSSPIKLDWQGNPVQ